MNIKTEFQIQGQESFSIRHINDIPTPRLLVLEERVIANIARMRQFLESASPSSAFSHLCTHVKTHKSSRVLKMLKDAGISSYKVTLNELDMVLKGGCTDVFIAYPLLKRQTERVARLMKDYPRAEVHVQTGSKEHTAILREAARTQKCRWSVFLDLDVGMEARGLGVV